MGQRQSADVKLSRWSAQTPGFGRRRALKLQEDAARAVMVMVMLCVLFNREQQPDMWSQRGYDRTVCFVFI